jgi:hypothetical protein
MSMNDDRLRYQCLTAIFWFLFTWKENFPYSKPPLYTCLILDSLLGYPFPFHPTDAFFWRLPEAYWAWHSLTLMIF